MLSDLASERAALAGIYRYGMDGYIDVSDIVNTNTFTDEIHQVIYRCFENLLKDGECREIDVASVMSAASTLGFYDILSKEQKMLRAISLVPIKQENVRKMALKIKKLQIARDYIQELKSAQDSLKDVTGDESIEHILSLGENPVNDFVFSLNTTKSEGPELIGEGSDEHFQNLVDNPVDIVGISTGMREYDLSIGGGLRPGTVNLIGARPKVGKTLLADNVARHVTSTLGFPVLMLDTEMLKRDHRIRLWSMISGVPMREIETGRFAKDESKFYKVQEAKEILKAVPYHYINIAGQPFDVTLSLMRRWVTQTVGLNDNGATNHCLIIYDYLKLMTGEALTKNMQEYQVLGFLITQLHNFMVKYNVPCLAFVQLNKDGINREETDVVAQSDRLVWLCSNFAIFKKKEPQEIAMNPKYNRKLITVVTRHGEGLEDKDYINLKLQGHIARIEEGPGAFELNKAQDIAQRGFMIDETTSVSSETL